MTASGIEELLLYVALAGAVAVCSTLLASIAIESHRCGRSVVQESAWALLAAMIVIGAAAPALWPSHELSPEASSDSARVAGSELARGD